MEGNVANSYLQKKRAKTRRFAFLGALLTLLHFAVFWIAFWLIGKARISFPAINPISHQVESFFSVFSSSVFMLMGMVLSSITVVLLWTDFRLQSKTKHLASNGKWIVALLVLITFPIALFYTIFGISVMIFWLKFHF